MIPIEGNVDFYASAHDGDSTLIVVGEAGAAVIDDSFPGTTYTAYTGEQYHFLMRDIAYAADDDVFVIVGDYGNIIYSTSGAPPG